MKLKTSELQGAALDWAVAKCEGIEIKNYSGALIIRYDGDWWQPSTDWAQGGPIIEREGISLTFENGDWTATALGRTSDCRAIRYFDYSSLIAAMRCYVASSFGDEIEVPEELMTETSS